MSFSNRKFQQEIKAEPSLIYRYPMVVLDGVNHGIFSNGQLPIHILLQDITLDTEYETLLQDILQPISTFLLYCGGENGRVVLDSLNDYFVETSNILEVRFKKSLMYDIKHFFSVILAINQLKILDIVFYTVIQMQLICIGRSIKRNWMMDYRICFIYPQN